jgi:hypothetical protein
MISYDFTEQIVRAWITLMSDEPHPERTWVEGTNWDADISDVKQDIREAAEEEEFDRLHELQAKLVDLRGRKVTKGHWEYGDSTMTEGQYFHSLDYAGQREYLKSHDIRVEKVPKRDGVPGIHLILDGEDYGSSVQPTMPL